jgi:hypothetical protein
MTRDAHKSLFVALGLLTVVCLPSCSGGEEATPTAPTNALWFSESVTIGIQNEPCIAPATGPLSCRFVALPFERTDLDFRWRLENPANGRATTIFGPSTSLALPCDFSSGVARFEIVVKLLVWRTGRPEFTDTKTRNVVINRAAGACGT